LSQPASLFFAAGGRDYFRAEMLCDLNCRRADAAAAALHEQPFAGLEIAISF
jgi:hypothetical protein